jgi:hypothetical protein
MVKALEVWPAALISTLLSARSAQDSLVGLFV